MEEIRIRREDVDKKSIGGGKRVVERRRRITKKKIQMTAEEDKDKSNDERETARNSKVKEEIGNTDSKK